MTPLKLAEIEAEKLYPCEIHTVVNPLQISFKNLQLDKRAAFIAGDQRDRWISVEDALPELGKDVLVCSTGGVMLLPHRTIKNSTTGQIHWLAYGEPYDVDSITHWQPLPSPPSNP